MLTEPPFSFLFVPRLLVGHSKSHHRVLKEWGWRSEVRGQRFRHYFFGSITLLLCDLETTSHLRTEGVSMLAIPQDLQMKVGVGSLREIGVLLSGARKEND